MRSFPLGFFGNALTKKMCLGVLNPARCVRQWAITSSSVSSAPARGITAATTASTHTGMRQPEHRGLLDAGVQVKDLFDLAAGDILAARLDHVLLPVHDVEKSGVVIEAEVSGVEPAAAERLGGFERVVEVAEHEMRTAMGDLADRPGAHRCVGLIEDGGFDVEHGAPSGTGVGLLVCRTQRRGKRRDFGLSVEVPELDVG